MFTGALLLAVSAAQAQVMSAAGPASAARADPLDARARVPALVHRSALNGYRRLGDDPRVAWPEANETVNRIGGWRAYARQAQQPEPTAPASTPPAAAQPAPAAPAASGPAHRGHHRH